MLITMLADRFDAGGVLRARGAQLDVPIDLALRWIGDGVAAPVGNAREQAQGLRRDVEVVQDQVTGQLFVGQVAASVVGTSVDPAVRASRGYVVAADLRAANIAGSANCTVTDVERVAPDGTKLRGIRMTANAGTACTVDLTIRSATFPTGRVSTLIYSDPAAAGGLDPTITFWVADGDGFTQAFSRNGVVLSAKGWAQIAPGDAAGNSANKWAAGAGAPAWGSTAFTRLRYTLSYSAAQTPWIEIYEVAYNEDAPKSWIGISIDDGYDSAYTLGAPALERYGMRGSFGIIADKIGQGGYMTLTQLQDLVSRGHECVVHGPIGGTGSLNNYSASPTKALDVANDLNYHRNWLIANGLNTRGSANVYVYPQGVDRFSASDDTIRNALDSIGFVGGRRAGNGRQQKRNTRGSASFTHPIIGHTWTSAPAEAGNITAIVTSVNSAASERYDAVLMFHKFVTAAAADSLEIQVSNLELILQAIADNQLAGTQEPVLLSRLVYASAGLQRPAI